MVRQRLLLHLECFLCTESAHTVANHLNTYKESFVALSPVEQQPSCSVDLLMFPAQESVAVFYFNVKLKSVEFVLPVDMKLNNYMTYHMQGHEFSQGHCLVHTINTQIRIVLYKRLLRYLQSDLNSSKL